MSDWKPQCHRRKKHFKWSLILSRTPRASRLSLSLQMSHKSLCSTFGILSRRLQRSTVQAHQHVYGPHASAMENSGSYNQQLHKSRIDILWGMFYRENVDYHELIWEDLAYQINDRKEKRSRRKNMPFPQFIKVIINHFLKQYNSHSNLMFQHYHMIKEDGIVYRLKFVRICEDYQEYGLSIHETMLTEAIKQSESYKIFIKYSTKSEPEPEPVKRKTSSKRRVKKKVTMFADDNIIFDDPDIALELGKSISKLKLKLKKQKRKSSKVTSDPPKNLKGVPSLTLKEQEAADIMQALKERKKTSKRQPEQESEYSKEDKLDEEEKDDREGGVDDKDDETNSDKGDKEVTDAAKADAEKTSEVKDDAKKTELPPTSFSLSVSSALIEDENAIDKGVVDTVKDHKRKHDDEDPPAEPNQGKKTKWRRTKESESSKKPSTTKETPKGKSPSKCSKTGKSASAKKLVEEPTTEVVMDDTGEDVVCDDDQPQDISEPMTTKTLNPEWFTQPPRPPTPDPE
ncbi:hypothetical protein Tco_1088425 [Tanacetum coccineum]